MTNMSERLRVMSSRRERCEYGINDYWNACDDAAHVIDELTSALKQIAALQTWNECCQAVPQKRLTKADISNTLDAAIAVARNACHKSTGGYKC